MLTGNLAIEEHTNMTPGASKLLRQGSKSLKAVLKSLYCLISSSLCHHVTGDDPGLRAAANGLNMKLNTVTLSSVLFEELRDRLSFMASLISTDQYVGCAILNIDEKNSVEELLLLLRCCILMVRLHPNDLILLEKFQAAVSLHRLFTFREAFHKLDRGRVRFREAISPWSICNSCIAAFTTDLGAKYSNSFLHLLKQMLEVFLDEMFADGLLRESIAALESFSSEEQRSELSSIHIEIVFDAIAAHFLLSISGEQALATFSQSFIWIKNKMLYTPELSLAAAISLVKHPIMSFSTLLHVHLISLVSEVISISLSEAGPNIRCTEIYLSAFQESVILYSELLSKLLLNSSTNSYKQQKVARKHFKQPQSKVYDKVNFVLADWESSWPAQSGSLLTKTNLCLVSDAISYLEMNVSMFDKSGSNNMFSFLSSLVRVISAKLDLVMLYGIKEMTMLDSFLLSSILKLMSCSMLQATRCCLTSSSGKKVAFPGWESLVGIMHRFKPYNLHLPITVRLFIVDELKSHFSTSEDTDALFIHFSFLLSLCMATGLDFLVRGCLFMMMVFMEGLILDMSVVEQLKSAVNSGPKSKMPAFSPVNATRVASCSSHGGSPSLASPLLPAGSQSGRVISDPVPGHQLISPPQRLEPEEGSCDHFHSGKQVETFPYRQQRGWHNQRRKTNRNFVRIGECAQRMSSVRVASEFLRARALLRDKKPTTNGVAFLKSFSNDASLISELADFIECKEGKDYNAYLKKKAMHRSKRSMKNAKQQWEKKKMIFNMIGSGSRRTKSSKRF